MKIPSEIPTKMSNIDLWKSTAYTWESFARFCRPIKDIIGCLLNFKKVIIFNEGLDMYGVFSLATI